MSKGAKLVDTGSSLSICTWVVMFLCILVVCCVALGVYFLMGEFILAAGLRVNEWSASMAENLSQNQERIFLKNQLKPKTNEKNDKGLPNVPKTNLESRSIHFGSRCIQRVRKNRKMKFGLVRREKFTHPRK